ncbi:MAG TPA: S8 family serine peptidase [Pyrinomonadaceae bacterium]|jgi:subtilisin family serine protease
MRNKSTFIVTSLLSLSLLVSTITGTFSNSYAAPSPAPAGGASLPKAKLSSDLRERVRSARPNERVTVIVQPKGTKTAMQDAEIRNRGGHVKQQLNNLNLRVVELPANAVEAFAARDDVEYVSPDRQIEASGHLVKTIGADNLMPTSGRGSLDGTGIGIAVFDSGVDTTHISFGSSKSNRVAKSVDFTGQGITNDPYGHGTHVVSTMSGSSSVVTVVNGATNTYQGPAWSAKVVNLRVLDSKGRGTLTGLLSAVDWVMANRTVYNIRVANMSLGMAAIDSYRNDPACKAVRRMVDAGIVVVVAAGNNGKDAAGQKLYGGIHSPGIEPSAITVGAVNTYGTDVRTDDTVATYSSRGPTRSYQTDASGIRQYDHLVKPELVAPGNKVVAAQGANNYLYSQYPQLNSYTSANAKVMYMSGTSVAAPVVAGAVAQILQANPSLTPNMVKLCLMYTAQQLSGFNMFEQGAGELNVRGATDLAKAMRTDLTAATPLGTSLLKTATPPSPQTLILGTTYKWSQGLILDHTYASGTELITRYQKIYGSGVLLGDGTLLGDGVLFGDTTMMTSGVLFGDSIPIGIGTTMAEGTYFCGTGVLLGDSLLYGDGVLFGDGILTSDGVLLGDGGIAGDYTAQSLDAMVNGDKTACMK